MRGVLWVWCACASVGVVFGACPNLCSGHGECVAGPTLECSCWSGWGGGDCSLRACPSGVAWSDVASGDDSAHASAECSNRGHCDRATGHCHCEAQYEGLACEKLACPKQCSEAGTCVSMQRHAELSKTAANAFPYSSPWDAGKIQGCWCDNGATGHDCALRECPWGDDPLTTGQSSEVQFVECHATTGYFFLTLDKHTSTRIAHDASFTDIKNALTPIAGTVSVDPATVADTQACDADGSMFKVTFLVRTGNVPALGVNHDVVSRTLGLSGGSADVIVHDGEGGTVTVTHPHEADSLEAVEGTREWLECSGRGICDLSVGDCHCFTGFSSSDGQGEVGNRGDCGANTQPVTSCPGKSLECSGHGTCSGSPSYTCTCESGFFGGDCSLRSCPTGRAWFDAPSASQEAHADDVECSGRGRCDRSTGQCMCEPEAAGAACQRQACPRDAAGNTCSGHGRCLTMNALALTAETNGEDTPFVYGDATPGLSGSTWDAFTMQGCHCDDGFHGFDCSLRTCPTGDDPQTPGNPEVQVLDCQATEGSFSLTFRDETTSTLSFDVTASDVEAALEALDTIESVTVSCNDNDAAVCNIAGTNPCAVTFLVPHGDVPDLIANNDSLAVAGVDGTFAVRTDGEGNSVTGTTEEVTCSNRGICNELTGICHCFAQYGSSNGSNFEGSRGDCGYLTPYTPVDFQFKHPLYPSGRLPTPQQVRGTDGAVAGPSNGFLRGSNTEATSSTSSLWYSRKSGSQHDSRSPPKTQDDDAPVFSGTNQSPWRVKHWWEML